MKIEGKMIERILIPVIFVFIGMLLLPLALAVTSTTVSIQDASASPGTTVKVPINIKDVKDLGAADIWLSYDKDAVTVEDVSDGNLGPITSGIDNDKGVTKMNWFSAKGKTGDFVFTYVTFKAVGDQGDISAVNLIVKELVNSSGNSISHVADSGIFTISGPLPTPTSTPSPMPSLIPSPPIPTLSVEETPLPTSIPSPTVTPTPTPPIAPSTPTSSPTPEPPGFEAVFAIAGLLAVAYLVLRRKK